MVGVLALADNTNTVSWARRGGTKDWRAAAMVRFAGTMEGWRMRRRTSSPGKGRRRVLPSLLTSQEPPPSTACTCRLACGHRCPPGQPTPSGSALSSPLWRSSHHIPAKPVLHVIAFILANLHQDLFLTQAH